MPRSSIETEHIFAPRPLNNPNNDTLSALESVQLRSMQSGQRVIVSISSSFPMKIETPARSGNSVERVVYKPYGKDPDAAIGLVADSGKRMTFTGRPRRFRGAFRISVEDNPRTKPSLT